LREGEGGILKALACGDLPAEMSLLVVEIL
jgi:hypothetical protein